MKCSWFSREGLTAALPPNVEAGRMAGIIRGTLLGAVFGGGILFACRYGSAYQSLMEWDPVRNRSVVRAGARMLPFWQTMEPALVLMALFALGALLSATVLYASYYQGGRSIYLMRRHPAPSGVDGAAAVDGGLYSGCGGAVGAVLGGLASHYPGADPRPRIIRNMELKEGTVMLEISHVTKKYRDKEALSDVSLTIPQGQIVGLLGENGAGKTTMMKCILGYLRHEGVVTLDGETIGPGNIHRLSFATCEHSFFPALSPADHRDFYQAHFPAFNDRRFRLLTEFFQLPLHKPLRSFSTGMKNQLEVTLALSQGADYILMDEPFSGSDLFNREDFYRVMLGLLSDHETVILSTHLLEEVKTFLSRAVLLRQGRLIGDISQQEMEDEDLVTRVKQTYHYQADRVRKALSQLPDEEG